MRDLAVALPRALAAFPARIASRPIRLEMTPRMRRRLLLAAAAVVAVGGIYQFWFRDSSFVAVENVTVTGLSTTKDANSIRAALQTAGEGMTTLHVDRDALDAVAERYPGIASIQVSTDFPHGLEIQVTERAASALVEVSGAPVPVAADGTVLTGVRPPDGLPVLHSEKAQSGSRVTDEATLRALIVVGAAPAGLPQRIDGVTEEGSRGIVIEIEDGPEILFGDADRAEAKWVAATRVLADPEAEGATYVDVRLPERPVAGGLPVETIEPVAPAGEPIEVAPPPAVDPATGAPIDPVTGAPVDPAAVPATDPAAAVPVEPTGGVTSP